MVAFHLRSISMPSTSHPLTASIEEQLYKLKTSQSSSIAHKLACLKELYECAGDFLQLPLTQQNLSHEWINQFVDDALNGSLGLLDMCSTTKDFVLQMRECVQVLESSLRRRRRGESSLNEVDAYMVARKKLNKAICKYLRNLKRNEKNCRTTTLDDDSESISMISRLKRAEEISLSVLESILSSISQREAKSKISTRSFVSKLFWSKKVSHEEEVEASEVEKIDTQLIFLKSSKDIDQVHNVFKGMEALDSTLQEAGEELECVYRQLIKTRVSLLNILNH